VKLLAFAQDSGARRLGVLDGDVVVDVTDSVGPDPLLADLERLDLGGPRLHLDEVRVLAPVARPGKIICVGLNYHDHCREQGIQPPAYPMLFSKFANAVTGPGDTVTRPRATEKLDLECELAVVIGRRAKGIGPGEALEHVFGYTIVNDVTMRDLQAEDRQWLRAKGSDGFAPMGPVVVTRDEIADPQALRMRSSVNGETWQESTTAEMVFDVATIVAFASRTITLEPGDVIATGTPAGVGHHQAPPRYVAGGDVMRCEIDGMGALENPVVDEEPRTDDHAAAAGVAELLKLAR
jgi:2-keto-4-pentenoate hydratase/2-oxohepta-3-ene-1,7-dioic acid hydratase in catechol pathway